MAPVQAAARTIDFRALFESQLGYVWATLRRLGIPERDRDDVAHDVFVAVHRHLEQYDEARPLRPWLFGFAFRCASEYKRRPRHRVEVLEAESMDAEDHGSTPLDERLASRQLLERAFRRLTDEKLAVVLLHDMEGWAVPDIALSLGEPVPTVYSRLRAGRE